jgi:branched-chain amino acid transport system permease protein
MVALLAEQTLNGVYLGCLLFLVSAGLGLVLGVGNFVNLAHGSFYMFGGYVAATVAAATGSYAIAVLLAVAAIATLGVVLERGLFRFLYGAGPLQQVLATFGLILAANDLALLLWGKAGRTIPPPDLPLAFFTLPGGVAVPTFRVLVIATALVLFIACALLVAHTATGRRIRATAEDAPLSRALGIDTAAVTGLVFALGGALAALAGAMNGVVSMVQSGMGERILLYAIVVVVLGGSGSMPGIFAGAMAIGLVDALGRMAVPELLGAVLPARGVATAAPALNAALPWLLVTGVLLARPHGLAARD